MNILYLYFDDLSVIILKKKYVWSQKELAPDWFGAKSTYDA